MKLIPWTREVRSLSALHERMNRLFRDFDQEWGVAGRWWPAVDVAEDEEKVVVRAEIPGIDPGQIEIHVLRDQLELRGEKKVESETGDRSWHRIERHYGSFVRTVPLPCPVDPEKATAESKNGILTITLLKREADRARKVEVKEKE